MEVGDILGYWKVLQLGLKDNYYHKSVKVLCTKCNSTISTVLERDLRLGKTKQCRKCNGNDNGQSKYKAEIGQMFGYWEVVKKNTNKIKCLCTKCNKNYSHMSLWELNTGTTMCNECRTKMMVKRTKGYNLTMSGYKRRLKSLHINVSIKEGQIYTNIGTPILHICPVCNNDWLISPANVMNRTSMCIKCSSKLVESKMISTLKQVLKHEKPKQIFVEYNCGFKGDKGHISRYDIYDSSTNTLIEGQSGYHDFKTELDKRKRKYALDNGYNFVDLDCRNTSPLEAIQRFFPKIKTMPSYVDMKERNLISWDIELAQQMLNNGELQKNIALIVGCSKSNICMAIKNGTLKKKIV